MNVINLTGNDITFSYLRDDDQVTVTIPASETIATVDMDLKPDINIEGLPIQTHYKYLRAVNGIPEPEDGTIYIVSEAVAEAVLDRSDLYFIVYIPDPNLSKYENEQTRIPSLMRVGLSFTTNATQAAYSTGYVTGIRHAQQIIADYYQKGGSK